MERLFFSYSRHDKDFVLRLAKDLRSVGVNLWIDQLDIAPGDRWDRGVEEALAAAPAVLVVLSPDSVNSQNVMDEVSLALDEKKRIVPILIRQCNVPFRLRRLQYVDFTAGYDAGLAALVGALNSQRQAGQEQAQTSDGAMPVSSQGPSGFAAPLLNAARVDSTSPGARARFPLKYALLGLVLVVAVAGLALVPRLLNRPPAQDVTPPPSGQDSGVKRPASYYAGAWANTDPETRGITRLNIRVDGPNLFVKAWGKCHPTDCEWPEVPATAYSENVSTSATADIRRIQALFKTSFDKSMMTIRPKDPDGLGVEILTHFTDNSGRANYSESHQFRRGS